MLRKVILTPFSEDEKEFLLDLTEMEFEGMKYDMRILPNGKHEYLMDYRTYRALKEQERNRNN